MTKPRRNYTTAEEVALATQVDGSCPMCTAPLFYEKRSQSFKDYDLAHIYPLNPKVEEVKELDGVALLNADVNHTDNIIPLCTGCHTRFDKPRTRQEYEQLAAAKRALLERARQRAIFREFPLETAITEVISQLHAIDFDGADTAEVQLDVKSLNAKFNSSLPTPAQRKIRHAVVDYYQHVRREFQSLEQRNPTASQLIYAQVRAYYLKQKMLSIPQSQVYANVVGWIRSRTATDSAEAAEIVAAFFVQNCEVFE